MSKEFPAHPLADLFPLIEGVEFDELVASIKTHGLRDAIITYQGTILDGRNRYRACLVARVDPRFEEFAGDDPHSFVIDKNIHRRHLNESQRALVGAQMANLSNGHRADLQEKKHAAQIWAAAPVTVDRAAELLNVSRNSVVFARKVLKDGTKEEVEAVRDGKAAVSTIARQIIKSIDAPKRHTGGKDSPVVKASLSNRIKGQRMKAQIWTQLRDGLTLISGLPRPADAVKIVRAHDRTGLVDAKLFQSLNWLKEFAHEWSKRNETTAEAGGTSDDADDHADAGTGNAAS